MVKKPNIVYILWDHHAFFGHGEKVGGPKIIRPNFERIAREGVEFTRAYTACPLCGPARRTMLTGLFPHNHGEIKNDTKHEYDKELYLETLKRAGYNNYYFGKWHAGRGTAKDFYCEGFNYTGYGNPYTKSEYKDYINKKNLPHFQVRVKHALLDPNGAYAKALNIKEGELYSSNFVASYEHAVGPMTTPKETHEAFFLAHLACKKLEEIVESEDKTPFHLRVDFWGPHQPYYATPEFVDLYDPKDISELPSFRDDLKNKPEIYKSNNDYPISKDGKLIIPNPLSWDIWQEILAYNYAQQTLIDEAMGLILDKLEALGLVENTLLIMTSDHGDSVASFGGHFDKDAFMPEEMIRVPFLIRYPDVIPPGLKLDKLVSNLDLAPTILDAAGTSFAEPIDGQSLLPLFTKQDINWRGDIMCETHGHYTKHLGRVIITDQYKYIWNDGDMDELYDLKLDPFQLNNLINKAYYGNILIDMKARLKRWKEKTGDNITKNMIVGRKLKRNINSTQPK